MGTFRTTLACAVCLAALACETSNTTSHVVLNLGALHQGLTPLVGAVDTLTLAVSAPDIRTPLQFSLDAASMTSVIDVPAGPARTFEITGSNNESGNVVPTYWGLTQTDLAPDATVDLPLTAFAAGVVQGQVSLSDGGVLPATVTLLATAVMGRPAAPATVTIVAKKGQFTQPLPTGQWRFSGTLASNGNTYSVVQPSVVDVSQGQFAYATLSMQPSAPTTGGTALAFVVQPAEIVAGSPFAISVGITEGGKVNTSLSGTITVSLQGATSQLRGTTTVDTTGGIAQFNDLAVNLAASGYTLTATALAISPAVSNAFNVEAGGLVALSFVQFPASVQTGSAKITVLAATDALSNPVPDYTGTVAFTSSDTVATLPPSYTYTAADAGIHTFSPGTTFNTAGNQTLSATDGHLQGSTAVKVTSGFQAIKLSVSGAVAGQAGAAQNVVVSAIFNSAVYPSYAGSVQLTSNDSKAVGLPANYSFTTADAGVHTFTAIELQSAQSTTLTATDINGAAGSGNQTVAITAADTSLLVLSGLPATATSGAANDVVVTARDPYGNVGTSYPGTVSFSSTDSLAVLPATTSFVPATDAGIHTFSVTFTSVGAQSITATDTTTATITGNQTTTVQ